MAAPPIAGGPTGMPGSKPPLHRALAALQIRDFRFLYVSSTASFLGMQMMMIGRGVLAWNLTESYAITGLLALSFGIPMLTLSLIGGATADRIDKPTLILVTQFINGASAVFQGVLIASGLITVPLLFGMGLIEGTMFAFMMPARQAVLRDIVPGPQIMNAMALSTAAMSGTTILGPAIAGGLIAAGGVEAAYFAMAAMAATSFLSISRLPRGSGADYTGILPRPGVFADVGAGLGYVLSTPRLRLLLGMTLVPALFGMPYQMMLPGFATEELGRQTAYATMLTISGFGALAASLGLAMLTEFRRKWMLQVFAGMGMGCALAGLGVGSKAFGMPAAFVAVAFIGMMMTSYQTFNGTLLMTTANPQYMGRVMSIIMLSFSSMPLMAYPLGVAADAIGSSTMFIIMGSIIITIMIALAGSQRRALFREDPLPAPYSPSIRGIVPRPSGGMVAPLVRDDADLAGEAVPAEGFGTR
ncbi:MAG: hypothetical protein Kow0010_06030 [Dehalococcoidia bacterium]